MGEVIFGQTGADLTYDIKLRSKNVYRDGEFQELELGIKDGKICSLGNNLVGARKEIDLDEKLLLPGIIDGHVHFREPGDTEKEGFGSGSRAALRGGVTTVVDMPNNKPPIKSPELFEKKVDLGRKKSLVNFGLYAGIPEEFALVGDIQKRGAMGFKHYMAEEALDLEELIGELEKYGSLFTVHAEDPHKVKPATKASTPEEYLDTRPSEAEIEAVKKLVSISYGRLHIAHVTLPETLSIIKGEATSEITPHHLLLSREDLDLKDYTPVCNPPIRDRDSVQELQKAFSRGRIDIIASDHAPHLRQEKLTSDPRKGMAGIPGVETILPLSLTFAHRNDIPLSLPIDMLTRKPAKLFRLEKRGVIREGYWADLTVVDARDKRVIRGEDFLSRAKVTPFEGTKVSFTPLMTFVNGEQKYRGGTVLSEEPGEFLRRGRDEE